MYAPRALLATIGYEPCAPRKNVVFLKTHKCASSTVMNILLRYGTEHGLNYVLPKSDSTHYIGHPEFFSRRHQAVQHDVQHPHAPHALQRQRGARAHAGGQPLRHHRAK
ncbi:hypothetical protein MTO96_036301, partial [Rhipicephalus appendiculatus]